MNHGFVVQKSSLRRALQARPRRRLDVRLRSDFDLRAQPSADEANAGDCVCQMLISGHIPQPPPEHVGTPPPPPQPRRLSGLNRQTINTGREDWERWKRHAGEYRRSGTLLGDCFTTCQFELGEQVERTVIKTTRFACFCSATSARTDDDNRQAQH
ncbi:unnamed protein product [Heligmosomoides polygyrus]|uniref:Uncharacterized protein n=1 Tax=Heligmosomoides polygyrus TaxID=6339 RepID=A0A183FVB3_HELPZ|nr:unnamed protein product [Heligmosomoides polygyrus]